MMFEKYYLVEEISEFLGMHPKTIQRYIREGKLKAKKIGKSWRVSGHDLSLFVENSGLNGKDYENQTLETTGKVDEFKVKASSVVDIKVKDKEEAIRIGTTLTSAAQGKSIEHSYSTVHTQYITSESIVRINLWGHIDFVKNMLSIISALTQE